MYGLIGFGDAAASVPCPANPTLLSGTTACDAATLAAVPMSVKIANTVGNILNPGGGVGSGIAPVGWAAIGLVVWLLFSGGKR